MTCYFSHLLPHALLVRFHGCKITGLLESLLALLVTDERWPLRFWHILKFGNRIEMFWCLVEQLLLELYRTQAITQSLHCRGDVNCKTRTSFSSRRCSIWPHWCCFCLNFNPNYWIVVSGLKWHLGCSMYTFAFMFWPGRMTAFFRIILKVTFPVGILNL